MKDYGTEEVLVVPREVMETVCDELITKNGKTGFWIAKNPNETANILLECSSFVLRNEAENNPAFKQLIPYCIIVYSGIDGDLVLHYSRAKSGGEERLHAKRSIGVGGHINPNDVGDDSWMNAVYRELEEEIGITQESIQEFRTIGFVNDEENPVGQVHLGIVHVVVLNTINIPEVEEHLTDVKWDTLNEIELEPNLETWTQEILSRIHAQMEDDSWLLSNGSHKLVTP